MRGFVAGAAHYAALIAATVVAVFPVYWIIALSLMPPQDTFHVPPKWLFAPTLDSYRLLFHGYQGTDVFLHFRNSVITSVSATAITVAVGVLGAYATSRFRFRGRSVVFTGILIARMLPPVALTVPLFLLLFRLGLIDTTSGLALVYAAMILPFAFWMLHNFINTVPEEVADAALVDGCTELSALWRVVLPMLRPGLVSAVLFSFTFAWTDFALAAVLTNSRAKTMPLFVNSFQSSEGIAWGPMAAGTVLAILPPVLILIVGRKWLIAGLTMGAGK
ncbi:carbohydrate ABC transporter permease [Actinoallomurus iriomotensis]|uniref:Maltose ABC transporter permease n=1 Tax=Actinoallomurus iriomotensis TaxID=478107 RepID=A0A9W6SEB6_9ACTN|nr:carbohydrate ABC transporter permease [Actinoallomurus iriomotensis]GLY92299.1 maltose ABC transporter permease [Actinoallomurus iriomotensis]